MEPLQKGSLYQELAHELEQRIEQETLELPMLPRVVSEVLTLVNDPDSDMAALARLIQTDPSLAAHIMRVVNSAAFAGAAKMTSLHQAIARMGMKNLSEIALAISMGPALFKAPGFDSTIQSIWHASLGCALWSREVARLRRQNVEVAFLAGMLSEIGKPAVLMVAVEASQKRNAVLDEATADELMLDYHPRVAAFLTKLWHLPIVSESLSSLYGLITWEDTRGMVRPVVENIKAASCFSQMMAAEDEMDAEALMQCTTLQQINLYSDDVNTLLEKTDVIRNSIAALTI